MLEQLARQELDARLAGPKTLPEHQQQLGGKRAGWSVVGLIICVERVARLGGVGDDDPQFWCSRPRQHLGPLAGSDQRAADTARLFDSVHALAPGQATDDDVVAAALLVEQVGPLV